MLGSEWHVYDESTAVLVEAEAQVVRDAVVADVPVLGICFGGQVIAHALGGEVMRTDRYEIGWYEVEPLAGAPGDFVAGPWVEWHDDVFSVPEGFDVLARTESGPQLVRGGRVLGTQFHPECTETMLTSWLRTGGAEQYRQRGATHPRSWPRPGRTPTPAESTPACWSTGSSTTSRPPDARLAGRRGPGPGWERIHESW